MKMRSRCLLALVLCCAMLMGMCVTAAAVEKETITTTKKVKVMEKVEEGVVSVTEETVTETYEIVKGTPVPQRVPAQRVSTFSIGETSWGETSFTTFADLKELAAQTYSDWTYVYYQGEGPLVITEDLTLPENLCIDSENGIEIAEGVQFVSSAHIWTTELVVKGTMKPASIYVAERVEITGALHAGDFFAVDYQTEIIGEENIVFPYEWSTITRGCSIASETDLINGIQAANASQNPRDYFSLEIATEDTVILTQSHVLPANSGFYVYNAGLEISEGATLTVNDYVSAGMPITVEGGLVNNGYINLYESGILTIAEGGSYSGSGSISVDPESFSDYKSAVVGVNWDDFEVQESESGGSWRIQYVAGLTKLGNPTELRWGYSADWGWNDETQTGYTYAKESLPGEVCWRNTRPFQGRVELGYYRVDGEESTWVTGSSWYVGTTEFQEYMGDNGIYLEDLESGDYYFTVTSRGDYTEYRDSDTVKSDVWTYVKPAAKLEVCTNLGWNWPEVTFDAPGNANEQTSYFVDFYYGATETAEPKWITAVWFGAGTTIEMWDWEIEQYGIGYYYYKIRPVSHNIEEICSGESSEMSEGYYMDKLPTKAEVSDIINGSDMTTEEKVDAIQSLDTEELKTAMAEDSYTSYLVGSLEEEACGGAAAVEVTDEASAFAASEISVVGANLNTNTQGTTGDITLVVDKPEEEHVLPEVYHNTVAVSFSMTLDNVDDPKNLEVPVEITLPVPSNINPEFLVILHYHVDGTYEEIFPEVYGQNGQFYARFVVSSFSDFVMIGNKYESSSNGDLNGDGSVDDSDVAQLLWHTLFPDTYTIEGNADFNGDGTVDDADVAYLLWHTLFPDLYPIG